MLVTEIIPCLVCKRLRTIYKAATFKNVLSASVKAATVLSVYSEYYFFAIESCFYSCRSSFDFEQLNIFSSVCPSAILNISESSSQVSCTD